MIRVSAVIEYIRVRQERKYVKGGVSAGWYRECILKRARGVTGCCSGIATYCAPAPKLKEEDDTENYPQKKTEKRGQCGSPHGALRRVHDRYRAGQRGGIYQIA